MINLAAIGRRTFDLARRAGLFLVLFLYGVAAVVGMGRRRSRYEKFPDVWED